MSKHCGYVAIVGRPNVGKSTLLNYILQQKLSITSPKPQTTRYQLLGIKTEPDYQMIFVDTPGMHQSARRKMNKRMNQLARSAMHEVDVVLFVVEALVWESDDQWVLDQIQSVDCPIIVAVNKVDKVSDKTQLLPYLSRLKEQHGLNILVPIAAKLGKYTDDLEAILANELPAGEPVFPADQLTDRSEKFLACEIIREKLTRALHHELPYALAVEIELFKHEENICHISAIIWVETPGQKGIVIGAGGKQLKVVGQRARMDMERLFGYPIYLNLWVKVRRGWPDEENVLGDVNAS